MERKEKTENSSLKLKQYCDYFLKTGNENIFSQDWFRSQNSFIIYFFIIHFLLYYNFLSELYTDTLMNIKKFCLGLGMIFFSSLFLIKS